MPRIGSVCPVPIPTHFKSWVRQNRTVLSLPQLAIYRPTGTRLNTQHRCCVAIQDLAGKVIQFKNANLRTIGGYHNRVGVARKDPEIENFIIVSNNGSGRGKLGG